MINLRNKFLIYNHTKDILTIFAIFIGQTFRRIL